MATKIAPTSLPPALLSAAAATSFPAAVAAASAPAGDAGVETSAAAVAAPVGSGAVGIVGRAAQDRMPILRGLLNERGEAFERALAAAFAGPEARGGSLVREAMQWLAPKLHSDALGLPVASLIGNYLARLRVVRLAAAVEGMRHPTIVVPFAGYDVLPALLFPRVVAIDQQVATGAAPLHPEHYRERLVSGNARRLTPGKIAADRLLRALFDEVACNPRRYRAIRREVFSERSLALAARGRNGRILFLKGLEWMKVPLSSPFRRPGAESSEIDRAGAALWIADRLTEPGDVVALWDAMPGVGKRLAGSGRYERFAPAALNREMARRLAGVPLRGKKILLRPNATGPELYLMIPRCLALFRRG